MEKALILGIFFVSHSLVYSEPSFVNEFHEHEFRYQEHEPKNTFVYCNPGMTTFPPVLFNNPCVIPEISFGMRNLSQHHVFDRAIGLTWHREFQLLYLQFSYLHFPQVSEKFYFGVGITGGVVHLEKRSGRMHFAPYINVPFTLGYQFPSSTHIQFIQLQVTPLITTTLSYGFGF